MAVRNRCQGPQILSLHAEGPSFGAGVWHRQLALHEKHANVDAELFLLKTPSARR